MHSTFMQQLTRQDIYIKYIAGKAPIGQAQEQGNVEA